MIDNIKDKLDKNIYARAGAGTGKTTKLIQRLNSLLKTNVDPKKIVIITFTHAASDEISNRIKNEISLDIIEDIFSIISPFICSNLSFKNEDIDSIILSIFIIILKQSYFLFC